MQAFLEFLPSLAENFYRVWRKYFPRMNTDVRGNRYINPNMSIRQRTCFVRRAERCVSQCDVDMLFALNVRCFELFKVQSEAMRYPCL